jgi:hypothetical protein
MKFEMQCLFCGEKNTIEVDTQGWETRYCPEQEFWMDDFICPKHIGAKEWLEAQCPGCVEGFPDCSFTRKMDGRKESFTENDFAQIRCGVCPVRYNGTFGLGPNGFEDLHLDSAASTEAGKAMDEAVSVYIENATRWLEERGEKR